MIVIIDYGMGKLGLNGKYAQEGCCAANDGLRRFNKALVQPAIPLCLWQKLVPWTFG